MKERGGFFCLFSNCFKKRQKIIKKKQKIKIKIEIAKNSPQLYSAVKKQQKGIKKLINIH